jgi:hypothetical protein
MADLATIATLIKQAESYQTQLQKDRLRAIEYNNGTMNDTPSEPNRSSMVSKDVRAVIKKALPSVIRTILGNDQVVEYLPVGPEDEESAKQASDYVNYVVLSEGDAVSAIEDAIHDALLLKNGILRWYWDSDTCVSYSDHTGLTDDEFSMLAGDDSVTVLEHTARQEMTDMGPVTLHDCKIKRVEEENDIRVEAVPHERFLIHPDATCIEDSAIVGERTEITRSELVEMGYDRELVAGFAHDSDDEIEEIARREVYVSDDDTDDAMGMVDYYDLYVRADMDGDGVAELRHMVFAGGTNESNLLINEEVSDVQFCTIRAIRAPHQWEGISIADDVMDVQRGKTVLLRQTLDNLYWQNNPQPTMQEGAITNEEAVYNPAFGKPIRTRAGINANEAIQFLQVPFVAEKSFAMLDYFDREAQDRTGISDASGGLPPDALQNVTAKASAMMEQQSIGQAELMVRTLARDLRALFKGILRLMVRHQDVAKTVRLRGKWVSFDPRDWNASMDCTVNVGLGAGTRERDMMMMQQIIGLQDRIVGQLGVDNPFVKPDNAYNAIRRLAEAAGLKNPDLYFTKPDPQEVQQRLQAMANQPSPIQEKAQADIAVEQAKVQASRDREASQMQADLMVAQAEQRNTLEIEKMKLDWEREKFMMQLQADLATSGLSMDPNGAAVNPYVEATKQMMAQTQAMLGMISQHLASSNMPKRVVRDANGDIVGLEPVQPTMPPMVN